MLEYSGAFGNLQIPVRIRRLPPEATIPSSCGLAFADHPCKADAAKTLATLGSTRVHTAHHQTSSALRPSCPAIHANCPALPRAQ